MLKVDLHIHSHFSNDSRATPEQIIRMCVLHEINCVSITDHNSIKGALEIQKIAPFTVITGSEVKSSYGDIIGLFLQEDIPPNLTPTETAQAIKAQHGLVMIPHPFDRVRSSALGDKGFMEILEFVDIVESFNARNLFRADDKKARQIADYYNFISAVSSDAHTAAELGRTYQTMPEFDGTPEGFKASLAKASQVTKRARLLSRFAPTYAKIANRVFKL
ncbi:PHP domain-containing protein [SAR202 cluster bacterium AC-409-J13_OGT_754m]|nr:PHP domain-containing protein [SAR202 cluster bacterium AC-409-J13_OGT_754m]